MEKPQKLITESHDLLSITEYVSEKYNLQLDDNDVWHWFVDTYEPDNGSRHFLNTQVLENDKEWVKTMKQALEKEFGKKIPILLEW